MEAWYQVTIQGRLLQGADPHRLVREAVETKRRLDANQRCRGCRRPIREPMLIPYELCFECVDRIIGEYAESLTRRVRGELRLVKAGEGP